MLVDYFDFVWSIMFSAITTFLPFMIICRICLKKILYYFNNIYIRNFIRLIFLLLMLYILNNIIIIVEMLKIREILDYSNIPHEFFKIKLSSIKTYYHIDICTFLAAKLLYQVFGLGKYVDFEIKKYK